MADYHEVCVVMKLASGRVLRMYTCSICRAPVLCDERGRYRAEHDEWHSTSDQKALQEQRELIKRVFNEGRFK